MPADFLPRRLCPDGLMDVAPCGERPTYTARQVSLDLSLNEAILLFELLARFAHDD